MLTDELKKTIQTAYSEVLKNLQLRPRVGQRQMIAEIAKSVAAAGDNVVIAVDEIASDTPLLNKQSTASGTKIIQQPGSSSAPFCVVEAGTGTGKTLAYVVAVLPVAKMLGKKVVISSATVALQEQLVYKDLPDIQEFSGLDFSYSIAKGRGRYVCLSKLDRILELADPKNTTLALYPDEFQPEVDEQNLRIYQSMLEALASNKWDGDRDKWSEDIDTETWSVLATDRSQCGNRSCSNFFQCSFFKAREAIQKVDCLVTNHDLVLADMALGGGAILTDPAETIYVFDEGHHLADRAINHFSCHVRLKSTERWLAQLSKTMAKLAKQLADLPALSRHIEKIPALVAQLTKLLSVVYSFVDNVEMTSGRFGKNAGDSNQVYRFAQGVVPQNVQTYAKEASHLFESLITPLMQLHEELAEALEVDQPVVPKPELEVWYSLIGQLQGRAEASYTLWFNYATPDKSGEIPMARWLAQVKVGEFVDYELWSSPILAANQLQHNLWSRCFAVVVTSATLTALGSFDRLIMHSGVPSNSQFKVVPSPFNYHQATLVVPAMSCEPSDSEGHTAAIIEILPSIIDTKRGTLMLFSSKRQMRDVYEGLASELADLILMQGDRSKMEIVRCHKQAVDNKQGSIIFGLASFAEGIDLPGDYCAHVIIAKIPFAVPDQPVEAALSEWIEGRGGNAFMELSVPEASVRLLQASGRLLRTETDTGKITLLDRRIVTKRYGKAILDSLPPYRRLVS